MRSPPPRYVRDERAPGARVQRLGDEEAPELGDEERRVARLVDDQVERPPGCRSRPRWPRRRLTPSSWRSWSNHVPLTWPSRRDTPPAGQRAGGLAHVALVVAGREREELHELAGVVLVRRVLVRVGEREEELHRRIARDLPQQAPEGAHAVLAQHPVLAQHERRVLVARGEVVVPEQRELLLQRPGRADHPVEPPQDVVAVLVEWVDRLGPSPSGAGRAGSRRPSGRARRARSRGRGRRSSSA